MEDRYEIKGKIGQGGLGAVYKAHDQRMNRTVAIKRIIANSDDAYISEEATRQLIKEAGALASLQHPNIVTIYDVGSDEDGPFVVMELLTGDTLEDIICRGSFTWQDFRQMAMQILEALIAAQELNLVHRDLKPSNLMLTWLPSGKFQVKIVDFGLAKLSASPSLQTIDQHDGVFGSIYFMAPEQFERVPIDAKADLYAIGCVFYYALTGTYPFDGDTAAGVMVSHLQHHVTPIQEVREGIPLWACDWIMWHINRFASDRPESARQSLQFFLDNDTLNVYPELSKGLPAPAAEQPKRPRLLVPGAAPTESVSETPTNQLIKTASTPKPLLPPEGFKPSVHTTAHVTQSVRPEGQLVQDPDTGEAEYQPIQPVELTPPQPSPISLAPPKLTPILAAPQQTPTAPIAPTAPVAPQASNISAQVTLAEPTQVPIQPKKFDLRNIPVGLKIAIAAVLGIIVLFIGVYVLKKSGESSEAKLYNEMIALAVKNVDIPVNEHKLDILLRSASSTASNNDRNNVYNALALAKSTDGSLDVDTTIATFATTSDIMPDVRVKLIEVLEFRKNPQVVPILIKFAQTTKDTRLAVASINATRSMSLDKHFPDFLQILQSTGNDSVRRAAEENIANIISNSVSPDSITEKVFGAYNAARDEVVRHALLRLIGTIGGEKALAVVQANLKGNDLKDKTAAIVALGKWNTREGYVALVDYLSTETDLTLRSRAFDTAVEYNGKNIDSDKIQENWTLLVAQTKTTDEELKLIRGLAVGPPELWNLAFLNKIVTTSKNRDAVELAEKAILKIEDKRKVLGED